MWSKLVVAVGLVVVLTSLAAASPSGAAGDLTRVSGSSPFQPGGSHECSLDDPKYRDLESESSIAVDPTDATRIAVAWPQDNSLGVVVASTHDGGQTWNRSIVDGFTTCTQSSKEMNRVSHPRLSFAPDGSLYLAAFPVGEWEPDPRNTKNDIMVARSDDAGSTWSRPTSITTSGSLNDFDGMAVEPDTGAVDVIWAENEGTDSATIGEPIYLSRSTDQGQTWNKSFVRRATPGSIAFTKVSPLPGGELVVFSQEIPIPNFASPAPRGPIWIVRSNTKGEKWSAPVKLVEDAVNEWPSVAVTKKGSLFLAYRTRSSDGAFIVWLTRSDDGGTTWAKPTQAFSYPYSHGIYPFISLAVAGEQTVSVLHYTEGEKASTHQARITVSGDCGQTWTPMPLGRPFTLTGDLRAQDAMGFTQGNAPTTNGFVVSASLGGEKDTLGPTDMFVAPVEWQGIRNSSCGKRG